MSRQRPITNSQLPTTPNAQRPMGSAFEVPAENRSIGVDASIAEERPVAADFLDQRRVAFRDQNVFALARLGDVAAEGIGDEGMAEEGDAVGAGLVFVTDPVWRGHVYAVGDRMRALHGLPGIH